MAHLLDPCDLADDHAYAAACRELDDLLRDEPRDAAGTRAVELSVLIDNYEARRDGYDLAQMQRLLAQRDAAPNRGAARVGGGAARVGDLRHGNGPLTDLGGLPVGHHAVIVNVCGGRSMERTFRNKQVQLRTAVAGAVGAIAASPAFAATSFSLQTALSEFTTREWLLGASGLLLVIALIARMARGRSERPSESNPVIVEDAPDLRWWRNSTAMAA